MSLTWSLQALLVRHESYVADVEQDRAKMTATIEKLEHEKHDLEADNARTIEENRGLLDQLESLNNDISDSDTQIKSLTATLHSTQEELSRLSALAARSEELERQLTNFEREHAHLQRKVSSSEEEERTAVQRWKDAERTLSHLQDEIERIEHEASSERQRHSDVMARMERRRAVEKELELAAGRLKGAAATRNIDHEGKKGDVVSSFVKDILADNANLQIGIVELREMLLNSNDEVEKLRDQVMLHQPVEDADEEAGTLRQELGLGLNRTPSQEVHVHHHYYPPTPNGEVGKSRTPTLRRPRKKRNVVASGYSTSPASRSRPSYDSSSRTGSTTPSSSATILAQTSASLPQESSTTHRWSMQSSRTGTSSLISPLSSSPQSTTQRTSSLFDRVFSDAAMDSSRPTSPESNDPGSPVSDATKRMRIPPASSRSFSAPLAFQPKSSRVAPFITLESTSEEPCSQGGPYNESFSQDQTPYPDDEATVSVTKPEDEAPPLNEMLLHEDNFSHRPSLHRSTSHDSLFSISGMDIHAHQATPRYHPSEHPLRHRPSHLLLNHGTATPATASLSAATAARPAMARNASRIDSEGLQRSLLLSDRSAARDQESPVAGLGRKVGGWMFGRWGATPTPSADRNSRPPAAGSVRSASSASSSSASQGQGGGQAARSAPTERGMQAPPPMTLKPPKVRRPGVNQTGPIRILAPEVKATDVVVAKMDTGALQEVLDEAG